MLKHHKQRSLHGPMAKRTNKSVLMACGFIASSAFATPTPCPTAAYTLYLVPNFTCELGNKGLRHFGYRSAGIGIAASAISVTPVVSAESEGLQFAGPWNVGSSQGVSTFQNTLITFEIATQVPAIPALRLFFNGAFTGTGLSGVAENYCLNYALEGCPAGNSGQIGVANPPANFNGQVYFSPVMSVWVSAEVQVTSGVNGTSSISQVITAFGPAASSPPNTVPLPLPSVDANSSSRVPLRQTKAQQLPNPHHRGPDGGSDGPVKHAPDC